MIDQLNTEQQIKEMMERLLEETENTEKRSVIEIWEIGILLGNAIPNCVKNFFVALARFNVPDIDDDTYYDKWLSSMEKSYYHFCLQVSQPAGEIPDEALIK